MIDRKRGREKGAALLGRISVEAIVVILVASATIAIFTMKIMAGVWEDSASPVPGKVVGLRHEAISPAPPADTPPQEVGMATANRDREGSNDTVVRNGVTILSPPLRVPVINADAIQMASGLDAPTSLREAPNARNRTHYANRAHARSHRRVARSAPFWRIVAK